MFPPVSRGHWETSEALTSPSLPSASLGMVLAHTHTQRRNVRTRRGANTVHVLSGVMPSPTCAELLVLFPVATGLFFNVAVLATRSLLSVFDPLADSVFHVLFALPAHAYY